MASSKNKEIILCTHQNKLNDVYFCFVFCFLYFVLWIYPLSQLIFILIERTNTNDHYSRFKTESTIIYLFIYFFFNMITNRTREKSRWRSFRYQRRIFKLCILETKVNLNKRHTYIKKMSIIMIKYSISTKKKGRTNESIRVLLGYMKR